MENKKLLWCFILLVMLTCLSFQKEVKESLQTEKPKVCFSFDDGDVSDMPGYNSEVWNKLILEGLKKNKVQAILFVCGKNLDNEKGKKVIDEWNENGHLIANHTYSHNSLSSETISLEAFEADFLKNDSLINLYTGYVKYFRFPFLKEGNTKYKVDNFKSFLKAHSYKNGYVTIDASDWYINSRLIKRLKQNTAMDLTLYKQFYLDHIYERATFYNELALKLTGRQINHTLLLHHNLCAALFVDDLITMFKKNGWDVVNVSNAYKDPIYDAVPNNMPAGESLIWALAKESGKYEKVLRYPAEDSYYEEPKMNKLGL